MFPRGCSSKKPAHLIFNEVYILNTVRSSKFFLLNVPKKGIDNLARAIHCSLYLRVPETNCTIRDTPLESLIQNNRSTWLQITIKPNISTAYLSQLGTSLHKLRQTLVSLSRKKIALCYVFNIQGPLPDLWIIRLVPVYKCCQLLTKLDQCPIPRIIHSARIMKIRFDTSIRNERYVGRREREGEIKTSSSARWFRCGEDRRAMFLCRNRRSGRESSNFGYTAES